MNLVVHRWTESSALIFQQFTDLLFLPIDANNHNQEQVDRTEIVRQDIRVLPLDELLKPTEPVEANPRAPRQVTATP